MNKLGYKVTVVEIANEPRTSGTPVDVCGTAVNVAKRMQMFEQIKSNKLNLEAVEFKNSDDVTEGSIVLKSENIQHAGQDEHLEIERDKMIAILFDALKSNVEFIFGTSITALEETKDDIQAIFTNGSKRAFDLVLGCDGSHSRVRKIWFGHEAEHTHFLGIYFSISIVNKTLIKDNTMQMYNVPDKAIMLNAYNSKTDITFCFFSEQEISYDYRDAGQQRKFIEEQFSKQSWRTTELLEEVKHSENFYFDKLCQIKMPSWTNGRVALIGDAGYCASPASGMGASLAMVGAATLADALEKHSENFELAFQDYNKNLRPFVEEVQATAQMNVNKSFIPRTEEAIRKRNLQTTPF
ncbi:FAD-binding monooxygenase [Mucilaginibacter robiniae]|uniref:FAD-binding monooxygenase n=1 Tax=Mucilaginibacter robiniae TaxID=2728022 RepID=A0A7L5E360_9SPHI|nr:FAD-binding monooxygenase [Mucilaginibacter robiniae]